MIYDYNYFAISRYFVACYTVTIFLQHLEHKANVFNVHTFVQVIQNHPNQFIHDGNNNKKLLSFMFYNFATIA